MKGKPPFPKGYLLTWLDQELPRETAIEAAVKKTEIALQGQAATSPHVERIRRIRDVVIAATKTRDIVSSSYLQNELGCSQYELETAITRAIQLYPDLKEIKIFNFRHFYHASMQPEDLNAAIAMKRN
jgi:hypothetical protein